MATLFITELVSLGFDPHGGAVLAPQLPSANEQSIAIGGASVASAAFGAETKFVMINTDTACCLAFGVTPVAVTTAHRMGANETRFYSTRPGDSVAVIASV